MRRPAIVDHLVQDARFTLRQLRKEPGFAWTAIVMLALGLCASVSIFAFVDAALIRPLPYPTPSRLVGVFESNPSVARSNLSYLDYRDWKALNTTFASLSAFQGSGMTLSAPEGAERAPGARVSDDFFRTLGVTPALGRDFQPGEDHPDASRTVILSYGAWQTRYGGQQTVLGETVRLNGEPHVIVGVLPREFHFAPVEPADYWIALRGAGSCELRRSCHNLYGVARLADGVSIETAGAEMTAIAKQLERQFPDSNRDQGAAIVPLTEVIVGPIRPILMVLLGGALLLLVIAGVNVASLLLVRSEGRRREMAVRTALGASAGRVVRQFAAEAVVLVALGATAGLALAYWATHLLMALIPPMIVARMSYLRDLGLNLRVLGFAGAVTVLAAVLCSLTPTWHLSLSNKQTALTEGSRGSAGNAWRRLGSKLVVVELAMAVVLLVGAGLLGQSLYQLLRVDIGFRPERLVMVGVAAPGAAYSKNEQQVSLHRQILDRIAQLPGVTSVGISSTPPLAGGNTMWIRIVGKPYHGEHNDVHYREVSAGYFATLQARLVRGRYVAGQDDASKPPVVVINQALARQYFPGEDPLGRQLLYASTSSQPMEIVGIIDDIKEEPIDTPAPPTMYVAFAQDPTSNFAVVVRTAQPEEVLLPTLTTAIHEIDPRVSTFAGRSMRTFINQSQSAYLRRSAASLVGAFAALAWLLGAVGLYGVVAYSVSQRTREIGVRMALGAQRHSIYRLVLQEAGWLTAVGIAIGAACSVGAATLMRELLFGVRAWDAPTLIVVALALGTSALLASFVPARRAASVSAIDALRAE